MTSKRRKEVAEPKSKYDLLVSSLSNDAVKDLRKRISEESEPTTKLSMRPTKKMKRTVSRKKPDETPIYIDSHASTSHFKTFKSNQTFVEQTKNDVSDPKYDKFKLCFNFTRQQNSVWYTFLNKPRTEEELIRLKQDYENNKRFAQVENIDELYAVLGKKMESNVVLNLPSPINDVVQDGLVEIDLASKWMEYLQDTGCVDPFRNDFQKCLFTLFNDYRDVYYPHLNNRNKQCVVESYVLHAINHLLKKNRYNWYNDDKRDIIGDTYQVRDKGYNQPCVLFLVPNRRQALEIVQIMLALMPKLISIRREEAFELTFSDIDDLEHSDDEESTPPVDKHAGKPEWFKELFKGNTDDDFSMGLTLHHAHGQFELLSKVLSSDIIIATPVAIQRENSSGRYDKVLSSIELCIIDQSDYILMQNWEYVVELFHKIINQVPTNRGSFDLDFTKIKDYFVYDFAKQFRQTILIGRYVSPDVNALLNQCSNVRGQVKIRNPCPNGIASSIQGVVSQIFERFECKDLHKLEDDRFDYFINEIYPRMKKSPDGIFLIMVSNHVDFIRVRNFLQSEHAPFVGVSEHSEDATNMLGRFKRQTQTMNYLLYTERHYYFHAPKLKDFYFNQVVFYSLPQNDFVYKAFVGKLTSSKTDHSRALTMFCNYDALALERIVGTNRCRSLLTSQNSTHLFD
ncbi:Diexf [Acrasis kona]|uniref:Diexf n=1 Tax=Acrasis kona TaxID=1008807 RepID=A0AAW2Z7P8_9EUKA